MSTWEFDTLAIHAGQEPDPATGAVMPPIYQTSTFRQRAVGEHLGYEYSRTGNPTRAALVASLAVLEDGQSGLAYPLPLPIYSSPSSSELIWFFIRPRSISAVIPTLSAARW